MKFDDNIDKHLQDIVSHLFRFLQFRLVQGFMLLLLELS